jgi:hypothetical protein
MFRTVFVVAALSVGLWGASARAATPWGGDDTGFIPPAKSPAAKCELRAAKAESKLVSCILKCHASRASGKLADETAEESCEKTLAGKKKSCAAKFAASIAKPSGCPSCINGTAMAGVAGLTEALIDSKNNVVYCDASSGTPWGGDDSGFIPAPAAATCEASMAKAEGNLIACIGKCHRSRASGELADDNAEDYCETTSVKSCFTKFFASFIKV